MIVPLSVSIGLNQRTTSSKTLVGARLPQLVLLADFLSLSVRPTSTANQAYPPIPQIAVCCVAERLNVFNKFWLRNSRRRRAIPGCTAPQAPSLQDASAPCMPADTRSCGSRLAASLGLHRQWQTMCRAAWTMPICGTDHETAACPVYGAAAAPPATPEAVRPVHGPPRPVCEAPEAHC